MTKKATPVRKQYLEIKKQHPDAILFFRLGDFYETFDEDAEIAARELDIVLTSRNIAKGVRVPMAGIPHHAAESYLGKLIAKGYHVAICEQIGDGPVEGLFPREVVRVITPGTVVEPGLLPGDGNNYLVAILVDEGELGLGIVDVSTGEFTTTQISTQRPNDILRQELLRLRPAETLVPESFPIEDLWEGHVSIIPDWKFESERAVEALREHFGVATLDGFGLDHRPLAISASAVILEYLKETQPSTLKLLTEITTYSLDDFMALDSATRRNLELSQTIITGEVQGSLLGVLDRTKTPMGRRLLRQWMGKPLLDVEQINHRLDEVENLHENGLFRAEIRKVLAPIGDLERLSNRVVTGSAGPRDLVDMRAILARLPEVIELLDREKTDALEMIREGVSPCAEVLSLLERALNDEPPAILGRLGIIQPGYSKELDELVESSREARDWISNLEAGERERTGIKALKVGYNKVFGYYLEVTKANTDRVPEEYIRKQTLVNAERYITPEMKDYEARVLSAEERMKEMESELFRDLCSQLSDQATVLLSTARALARLDVVASLAEVASNKGYVRPEILSEEGLEIRDGRHPVVEEYLSSSRFVPNDTIFQDGEKVRIITGPNMSGKSTYLRQVALIVFMAQIGSFVPAESARMGLTDRIFTRIGAQDEIHAGQSTFMVEMVETANILHNASARSLLILDEVGRGTSTYDGMSIAWAVVEYIHNHPRLRARTLFATHYHELIRLAEVLPAVRNYNVAVSEEGGEVVFLHKILPGGADKSYGIHVAELAGLPRPVINRAQQILSQLEASSRERETSDHQISRQLAMFQNSDPLLDDLRELDLNSLTPLEALNRLYEWQKRFLDKEE